jgi:hypothetical protein
VVTDILKTWKREARILAGERVKQRVTNAV